MFVQPNLSVGDEERSRDVDSSLTFAVAPQVDGAALRLPLVHASVVSHEEDASREGELLDAPQVDHDVMCERTEQRCADVTAILRLEHAAVARKPQEVFAARNCSAIVVT